MTDLHVTDDNGEFSWANSNVLPIGQAALLEGLHHDRPHCFLGVELFSDAAGLVPATAGGGTFDVVVKTPLNPQVFEATEDPQIDATALTTIGWDAPIEAVRVTPTTVTGPATHYRVRLRMYRS